MAGNIFSGLFYSLLNYLDWMEAFRVSMNSLYPGLMYDYAGLSILYFVILFAFFATMYVLMGIGLYKLSVKHRISTPWLSFVPFARYYQMGKLVGPARFFGVQVKNLGLVVLIAYAVSFLLTSVYDAVRYANAFFYVFTENSETALADYAQYINNATSTELLLAIFSLVELLSFFVYAFMLITFFRYYEKRHPILYAVLSLIFGLSGIFVFVVRNHDKYDYIAEMRRFYERRMNETRGGTYGRSPDGNQNGYYGGAEKPNADIDVFEEYSDKKNGQGGYGDSANGQGGNSNGNYGGSGDGTF